MKLKSGVVSYTKAGIILKRAFHAYIKILVSTDQKQSPQQEVTV